MNETCIECGQFMHERGGPCTVSVELDQGDQYTGGGSAARVRLCGACGKNRIDDVLRLTQAQWRANAEAARAGR